jgi:cell division protein FtsB
MSQFLSWCRRFLKIPTLLVFGVIVYLTFFQENSAQKIFSYNKTIDSLNYEIKVNRDTMEYYRQLNQRMDNHDPTIIEQVVRERLNMNRPNEDVYVVQ